MSLKKHFELLASYNQWMNSKIYEAATCLSASDLTDDRGAFFGSILGTLNHILVADIIWGDYSVDIGVTDLLVKIP